jgi:hypothetical protein
MWKMPVDPASLRLAINTSPFPFALENPETWKAGILVLIKEV